MLDFYTWLKYRESGAPYRNLEKSPVEYPPLYYTPIAADAGVKLKNKTGFLHNTKKKKKKKKLLPTLSWGLKHRGRGC